MPFPCRAGESGMTVTVLRIMVPKSEYSGFNLYYNRIRLTAIEIESPIWWSDRSKVSTPLTPSVCFDIFVDFIRQMGV